MGRREGERADPRVLYTVPPECGDSAEKPRCARERDARVARAIAARRGASPVEYRTRCEGVRMGSLYIYLIRFSEL